MRAAQELDHQESRSGAHASSVFLRTEQTAAAGVQPSGSRPGGVGLGGAGFQPRHYGEVGNGALAPEGLRTKALLQCAHQRRNGIGIRFYRHP